MADVENKKFAKNKQSHVLSRNAVGSKECHDDKSKAGLKGVHVPAWVYVLLFVVFDVVMAMLLQKGVSQNNTRVKLSSPVTGVWDMVSKMWVSGNFIFLLNLLLLGLVYLAVLMMFNRFWIATPVMIIVTMIIALVEHFKVSVRYETILPSDLSFVSNGDAGSLMSFIPTGSGTLIAGVLIAALAVVVIFAVLNHFDVRHGKVFAARNSAGNRIIAGLRIVLVLLPLLLLTGFSYQVGQINTLTKSFANAMGYVPSMWDSVYDAQRNGPLVSFLGQAHPKVMDQPDDYNEATMNAIAKRYHAEAAAINKTRTKKINDSSVVFVLSESYSDPSRVPGLTLNQDPMPNIRDIKRHTTSGYMLSSGYGGGTANLEYMSLTGMSMANFDPSLTSPYQQLIPNEKWTPTVNQLWGSKEYSQAFHPYEPSMYLRANNYKKFGFSHFYSLQPPEMIAHRQKIDSSPYVSDESAYQSVYESMKKNPSNEFVQLATMQNHMPYHNWYKNNDFRARSTNSAQPLDGDETKSINTYAKGVNITDKATAKFLSQIDSLDKPVTVVFYGDHLPGIYKTASADQSNSLALHTTDYFIWSNKASGRQGYQSPDAEHTSPNFFMAQVAQQDDAKVTAFLAFLTKLHSKVSAIEPPVVNQIQGWSRIPEGQPIYLDPQGNPMAESDFDKETKQLINDYKLIQYDVTAGKGYLKDAGFME
ncbi:phosphoglycerol transferase MdoB-like AlkP superfamily enzyme [Bifidobacterium commune]|uniref:Sulfatase n=1 Tax=Bifidobacterium commune TaxID=1505727 RepID=A0A1C4H0L0_9BIFI|nr:LTA synthase family protein [Bifidobacterium commune]MBB2954642.1 phosphoglycerol transferase MdoB-like AlkP superfamily enzyme [Bifidobacterium commune]SCC78465.1 Sulfatase [Bifidobacterium commune]